ncbi:CHAD domain-containing protein [Streptomyces sp. NPDC005953]|uniref:CHAD domain-containing protein n=1 Tax=Streptomyces sp. NPDC005953 TaxID=3156719 RepID=UPI0033E79EEA
MDRASTDREAPGGHLLAAYLHERAGDFLRGLRLYGERGSEAAGAAGSTRAALSLRTAARRIGGTLHTFRPLLDVEWADGLRTELAWISGTLAQEHACTARLERLHSALGRLSGTGPPTRAHSPVQHPVHHADLTDLTVHPDHTVHPDRTARTDSMARTDSTDHMDHVDPTDTVPAPRGQAQRVVGTGTLAVGAARAAALLERQLTLARTRAHSNTLQALGSARLHAVADAVALLASELPLGPAARTHRNGSPGLLTGPGSLEVLEGMAQVAEERLGQAVALLPLARAGHPYNADALVNDLAAASAEDAQDAPWHQVRVLLRLHRYAAEVLAPANGDVPTARGLPQPLHRAGLLLDLHRDAAEAAGAAAAAARTPRIAPATAYALGVLHADQRHEVEAARFAFHEVWQKCCPAEVGR